MGSASRFVVLFAATTISAMPVFAQSSAPIPRNGGTVEIQGEREIGFERNNLPGVGLDTSTSNRDATPRGPGGLSNSVGAYGVMTPDASGTAGNTLTRVPGAIPDTNSGIGFPIGTPGAPVR